MCKACDNDKARGILPGDAAVVCARLRSTRKPWWEREPGYGKEEAARALEPRSIDAFLRHICHHSGKAKRDRYGFTRGGQTCLGLGRNWLPQGRST